MYFESHAHYDDRRFSDDRDTLLQSLPGFGVHAVINVGASMGSSKKSVALAEQYDFVYAAVGVHPHDVKHMNDQDIDTLEALCKHDKVVAVGEIGLDFHYDHSPRDVQHHWFEKQLELAHRVDKPVIIHSREADQKTFDMIKNSHVRNGVVHCFSGSMELAVEYVKLGFYIGVGGVVTYNNAKHLVNTVEAVSIENILLETDCPYLSPVPKRGERNDSQNLEFICNKIAHIKQIPNEEVAKITSQNAYKCFKIN